MDAKECRETKRKISLDWMGLQMVQFSLKLLKPNRYAEICYSEDSPRQNRVFLYDSIFSNDKQ